MSLNIDSDFDRKTEESLELCQHLLDVDGSIDSLMKVIRECLIRVSYIGRIISKHNLQALEDELEHVVNEQRDKMREISGFALQIIGAGAQMAASFIGAGAKTFTKGVSAAFGAGGQYVEMLKQAGLVPLQARNQAILSYLQIHQQSKASEDQSFQQAKAGMEADERARHEAFQIFAR
jgi:hypothetical protein